MRISAPDGNAKAYSAQLWGRCKEGIPLLINDGCKTYEQYARAALLLVETRALIHAGRQQIHAMCGGWLVGIQRFDYTDQPLQIWCLRFSVIDMGDVLIPPKSTQKAHRAPIRSETNQPAFLHVGVEGEWQLQGCPKRNPHHATRRSTWVPLSPVWISEISRLRVTSQETANPQRVRIAACIASRDDSSP